MLTFSSLITRLHFASSCFVFILLSDGFTTMAASTENVRLFVGTYTRKAGHVPKASGEGIYIFHISNDNGTISLNYSSTIRSILDPSYLAITKSKKYLYAVVESTSLNESLIQAYEISDGDESNRFIDAWPIGGIGACHVTIDDRDAFVFVSNYNGGSAAAFKIDSSTGRLERRNFYQFTEHSGVNEDRQREPHLHSSVLDAEAKFVYFADLGNDCVWRFNFSNTTGFDVESKKKFPAPPGAGPRHMVFDPIHHRFLYAACELTDHVVVYEVDSNGDLKQVQYVSTLGPNTTTPRPGGVSDIHVSPDGRFIYVATRFADIISVFEVQSNGTLKEIQEIKTGGEVPRNFLLYSPGDDSHFVLVGNQESHDIAAFRRDPQNGTMAKVGKWDVKTPAVLQICN